MGKEAGIVHVYLKPDGVHIVGDEEGLYGLWQAVAEAMISQKGFSAAKSRLSNGNPVSVHVLRLDRRSHFLKRFPPGTALIH